MPQKAYNTSRQDREWCPTLTQLINNQAKTRTQGPDFQSSVLPTRPWATATEMHGVLGKGILHQASAKLLHRLQYHQLPLHSHYTVDYGPWNKVFVDLLATTLLLHVAMERAFPEQYSAARKMWIPQSVPLAQRNCSGSNAFSTFHAHWCWGQDRIQP